MIIELRPEISKISLKYYIQVEGKEIINKMMGMYQRDL